MVFKSKGLLIIAILYLGFVSLGLPDQVLGVAWPYMRIDFTKPIGYAGLLVSATMAFTVISSYFSGYVMRRFSVPSILIVSALLTAIGMAGYAISPSFYFVLIFTIPLGLGAGSIDAALNSYAADNLSPFHMNLLHACWGIGAASGPLILTGILATGSGWRVGYVAIAFIQVMLTVIFVAGRKSFVMNAAKYTDVKKNGKVLLSADILLSALFFFLYTAVEGGIGVWFYSVLVEARGVSEVAAGAMIASYWISLTLGRVLIGFISRRIVGSTIITFLICVVVCGLLLLIPQGGVVNAIGLIIMGLGLSGIYPTMMSETPRRFPGGASPTVVGYQVGSASLGVVLLVPLTGLIIQRLGVDYLPFVLLPFIFVIFLIDIRLKRLSDKNGTI